MILLLLLLIFGAGETAAAATAASPVCDRYLALEKRLGCARDNYLREFGQRYCAAFEGERPDYSPRGKAFLDRVKVCLAEDMERAAAGAGGLGCAGTRERGLAGHERCYPAAGYCDLPWGDRARIVAEAWPEFRHVDFLRTAFKVLGHCASR